MSHPHQTSTTLASLGESTAAKHTATPYHLGTEYPSAYVQDLMTTGGRWTELNVKDHAGFVFIVTGMAEGDGSEVAKATAEFIVRACNAHEELQRMAELVVSAAKYRRDQEWKLMHLDLSEAAEIALRHTAGVQP